MNQQELLQRRFAEMETDALLAMWNQQERLPWADSLLRSELTARGFSSEVLDQGAQCRTPAPEIEKNKILKAMTFCMGLALTAAAANYYLNLGWFGHWAKLMVSAMTLLTLISLEVMIRLWRDEPRNGSHSE